MGKRATCAECGKRRVCKAWPDGRLLCGHCFRLYIFYSAYIFTRLLVETVRSGQFQREAKRQSEQIQRVLDAAMGMEDGREVIDVASQAGDDT